MLQAKSENLCCGVVSLAVRLLFGQRHFPGRSSTACVRIRVQLGDNCRLQEEARSTVLSGLFCLQTHQGTIRGSTVLQELEQQGYGPVGYQEGVCLVTPLGQAQFEAPAECSHRAPLAVRRATSSVRPELQQKKVLGHGVKRFPQDFVERLAIQTWQSIVFENETMGCLAQRCLVQGQLVAQRGPQEPPKARNATKK